MHAIELSGVSKKYILTKERPILAKSLFLPQRKEEVWALKDINLEIKKGETVGIIGENGSGKSTLLKIIAGITYPTQGSIRVNGRIGSLIELGAGFLPDLTGKENVYLNGALLGFTKTELDEKYNEIIDFADIGEYINQPVRTYSSGMVVRLGFAVAIHLNPDILLIDEVLAVGDLGYQRKSLDRIYQLRAQGKVIVFVSHNLNQVEYLCNRVVWLEKGRVRIFDESKRVINLYLNAIDISAEKTLNEGGAINIEGKRWGTREIIITEVKIFDEKEKERYIFATGEKVTIELNYQVHQKIKNPNFGVAIFSLDGSYIFGTNTHIENFPINQLKKEGKIRLNLEKVPLLGNTYLISAGVTQGNNWNVPVDFHNKLNKFKVKQAKTLPRFEGVSIIDHQWQIL